MVRPATLIRSTLTALCLTAPAFADSTSELLTVLQSVGGKGEGNVPAVLALREISRRQPAVLPKILTAFDGAGPLSANYLRGAFEAVADRAIQKDQPLPAAELESFVRDRERDPRARRLAYEWLVKVDPAASDRLIPGMLDDPGEDFRRDAVARLIAAAEKHAVAGDQEAAKRVYRQALEGAVHDDQVKAIVGPLRKLGETVELPVHFGLITQWQMIGPFDSRGGKGFAAVYPPEERVDFKATYDGQLGKVAWSPLATDHAYGIVDIAKQVAPHKGAAMYAASEFHVPSARSVEIRLGTPNSWKLWVNGRLVFAREEYHRGMSLDQYRVAADLKSGRNVILLKICQNEQDEDWAQRFQFQLRVCDGAGAAVLSNPPVRYDASDSQKRAAATSNGSEPSQE